MALSFGNIVVLGSSRPRVPTSGVPSRPACFTLYSFICSVWRLFVPFALRLGGSFDCRMLREELGWNQPKSDELLLPVIQRINKRGAAAATNKQSNLDTYFGGSIGNVGGSAIPRKRQAYTSKRLQKVVTDYREEQKKRSRKTTKRGGSTLLESDHSGDEYMEELDVILAEPGSDDHGEHDPRSESATRTEKVPKPTTTAKVTAPTKRNVAGTIHKTRRSSGDTATATSRSTKRKKRANDSDDYNDNDEPADADRVTPAPARPRPKPVRKKANTNTDAGS